MARDRAPDGRAAPGELLEEGVETVMSEHEAGGPEAPSGEGDECRKRKPQSEPGRCARANRDRALLDDLKIGDENEERRAEAIGALAAPPAEREGNSEERQHRYRQDTDEPLVELGSHLFACGAGWRRVSLRHQLGKRQFTFVVAAGPEHFVGDTAERRVGGRDLADDGGRRRCGRARIRPRLNVHAVTGLEVQYGASALAPVDELSSCGRHRLPSGLGTAVVEEEDPLEATFLAVEVI